VVGTKGIVEVVGGQAIVTDLRDLAAGIVRKGGDQILRVGSLGQVVGRIVARLNDPTQGVLDPHQV